MDSIPQAVIDGAGSMSTTTLLWIMGVMVGVITTLGQVITSLVNKRSATALQHANPLNGTLAKLNDTLIKIDMRTGDSDRVLEGHSEKLILLGSTMAQLAANEAQQTEVLRSLGPALDASLTGIATRLECHCTSRSQGIIDALDTGG